MYRWLTTTLSPTILTVRLKLAWTSSSCEALVGEASFVELQVLELLGIGEPSRPDAPERHRDTNA